MAPGTSVVTGQAPVPVTPDGHTPVCGRYAWSQEIWSRATNRSAPTAWCTLTGAERQRHASVGPARNDDGASGSMVGTDGGRASSIATAMIHGEDSITEGAGAGCHIALPSS